MTSLGDGAPGLAERGRGGSLFSWHRQAGIAPGLVRSTYEGPVVTTLDVALRRSESRLEAEQSTQSAVGDLEAIRTGAPVCNFIEDGK